MTSAGLSVARVSRAAGEILRPVLDFIYPPRCPACGADIGAQAGLCLDCWQALQVPDDGYGDGQGIVAASLYCELSRKLVLAFKHGGKIALAPLLAQLIAARLGEPRADRLIVPVPLHPLRLWQRGYNQSALLAARLQAMEQGQLLVDGLQRIRATPSLGSRSRAERAALLSGAIRAHPRRIAVLQGRDVLLVDDVLTSGATTEACAAALRGAGAKRVTVACFARVGGSARKVTPDLSTAPDHRRRSGKTNARDLEIPGVT